MARKPFFRAFDGWWYAQVRVGTQRKQIKLVKGKENEQEAYRAFASSPTTRARPRSPRR